MSRLLPASPEAAAETLRIKLEGGPKMLRLQQQGLSQGQPANSALGAQLSMLPQSCGCPLTGGLGMTDLPGRAHMRGRHAGPHCPCHPATGASAQQRTGAHLQLERGTHLLHLPEVHMTGLLRRNQTRSHLPGPTTWKRMGMLLPERKSLMRGQCPRHHQDSAASVPAGLQKKKMPRQGMSRAAHTSPTPFLPQT